MSNLLPQDNFDTYLTAALGTSDTTIYVAVLPTKTSGFLTVYDVDGRTIKEKIKYTSIASSPNRVICPDVTGRGLPFSDAAGVVSDVGVVGNRLSHPKNVRIAMTDNVHYLARALSQLNGDEPCGGIPKNPSSRSVSDARHLVDKEYADALTVSALPQFLVTKNGADPTLTVNIGAGQYIKTDGTNAAYAGGAAIVVLASNTNYVEMDPSGTVSVNQVGFTAGNFPLAIVVANGTTITSVSDKRAFLTAPMIPNVASALAGTFGTPGSANKFVTETDPVFINPAGMIVPFGGATVPSGWLLCDGSAVNRTTYARLFNALTKALGTFTITIAAPGVVTLASHGLATGDSVYFTTTGALPTGLAINTRYWVVKNDANSFWLATSQANALAGTKITTTGTQSGVHSAVLCPYGVGDGTTTFNLPNLQGKIPVGKNQSDTEFAGLGQAGGEKTHQLTAAEIPAHAHDQRIRSGANNNSGGSGGSLGNETVSTTSPLITTSTVGSDGAHNNLQPYITLNYIIKN